jgi:hypothetical protein
MKTGDLEPSWIVDISDASAAGDLSDVESWKFVASLDGTVVFTDTSPTFTIDPDDSSKGTIEHEWVSGETDNAGLLQGEIIAVWPGSREQTFPGLGQLTMRIEPSL